MPQPVRRGRWWGSGADRALLVGLAGGVVWWRWGLDRALLWVCLPALFVWGGWLLAKMATGQGWWDHLPRFGVVVILATVIAGRLFASGGDSAPAVEETCNELLTPWRCVDDQPEDIGTAQATPPTYIEAHRPVEPTCPDQQGESERRTNFTDAPPMCIDLDQELIATVYTNLGEFWIHLDPRESPEAVNSFVFLARWGYYNGIVLDSRPPHGALDGYEACKADWGTLEACAEHIDDYILVHHVSALPPFDPETDDYGPGYGLEAEPASSQYDESELTAPQYVILPYDMSTGDDSTQNHYVDASDFVVVFTKEARESLNENRNLVTPIGTLDDPEKVITMDRLGKSRAGRPVFTEWIIVETVIVETPDQFDARQDREELQEDLDKVERQLTELEQEFAEQLNPPLGEEPKDREDLDWDKHQELTDEREELQDAIDATYDD